MTETVAGHIFEGVGSDQCCAATVVRNGENVVCGRFWTEIEHCGLDDLGKPDLAHVGALNQTELDQIIAKREAGGPAALAHSGRDPPAGSHSPPLIVAKIEGWWLIPNTRLRPGLPAHLPSRRLNGREATSGTTAPYSVQTEVA
jgi:hypothetical protein